MSFTPNSITKTLKLKMSELLYDIQNKTYLTGKSRYDGQNHEAVANMQANDDDENINEIMRSITNAYTNLRTKLSEYLSKSDNTVENWMIEPDTEYLTFELRLPSNFNHYNYSTLRMALHQYIVNCAIADWFAITNKPESAEYLQSAGANLLIIREALNKRIRPTRKAPNPTGDNTHWSQPEPEPEPTTDDVVTIHLSDIGDLNGDGFVNTADISALYLILLGLNGDNSTTAKSQAKTILTGIATGGSSGTTYPSDDLRGVYQAFLTASDSDSEAAATLLSAYLDSQLEIADTAAQAAHQDTSGVNDPGSSQQGGTVNSGTDLTSNP